MEVRIFNMFTKHKPTVDEIAAEQEKRGYHPAGYGGPGNIRIVRIPGKGFTTTWECPASCD